MKERLFPLALKGCRVSMVRTYHLTFEPNGWATFYVDDQQGTLSIESDWGACAYRWGRGPWLSVDPPDLSRALLHFGKGGCDYIARKLFGGNDSEHDELGTAEEFRRMVIGMRRARELDRDAAREVWDDLDYIDFSTADSVVREIQDNPTLSAHWPEPWSFLCTRPSARFLVFREQLLPMFIEELRKDLEARGAA